MGIGGEEEAFGFGGCRDEAEGLQVKQQQAMAEKIMVSEEKKQERKAEEGGVEMLILSR